MNIQWKLIKGFVNMDNIQAIQISNLLLNANIPATSNVPPEQQRIIRI